MWLVEYIVLATKERTFRRYKFMEERQVRKIANNMKGMTWVRITKEW